MTGEQLKHLRAKAKLTQREVAEAIGLKGPDAHRLVSRWECGGRKINAVTAKALLTALTPKK